MIGYYDLVLGLIPAALVGITGALHGVGLTITTAVPLAAVVAAGLIGHAMFVNAPVAASTGGSTSATDAAPVRAAD